MKRLALVALLLACGNQTVNSALGIQPAEASVNAGQSVQLLALNAAPPMAWSVVEGASGGTISAGLYSATPCASVAAGTYHVQLTAGGKSATATVTVTPEAVVSVAISPTTATVPVGGTQQFTGTVTTTCGTFAATP